jgi:GTP pyrophosphokinase
METLSNVPLEAQTPWSAQAWLTELCAHQSPAGRDLLERAWTHLQARAQTLPLEEQEAYLRRRCGTADLLHHMLEMDSEALAAALLDVQESDADVAAIQKDFGASVACLVDGITRMVFIHQLHAMQSELDKNKKAAQMENLRKMFLAMAEDARVVLIKLAERLYDMRALKYLPIDKHRAISLETLEIFAPLANRLGIWNIKWELEDLAFRFSEPETYQHLAKLLEDRRSEREDYVRRIVADLQGLFAKADIKAQVYGRPKHIYSIWKKMQRKGVPFEQLFDIFAVRALVESESACYMALGVIHSIWPPIQGEFDDYIAAPKKNGYRSLHTAVMGPDNKPFEVQIRTQDMHKFAEFGVASHWRYKEGVAHDSGFEQKLAWLRQVLQEREEDDGSERDVIGEFNAEIVEDRVYALTPQGKIIDLPQGSTPLDFAYAVHTSIGHRCRGAKINGRMTPLSYQLKTGDQVEVLTTKEEKPSRDWLAPGQSYVHSPRARAKVKQWFKQQDQDQHLAEGRALLEKELRRLNPGAVNYEDLAQRLHFKHADEVFLALGHGELSLRQIARALQEQVLPEKTDAPLVRPAHSGRDKADVVRIQGVDGLLTQMAGCCKPMPPDPLIGYITRGQGITIHRRDCPQALLLQSQEHERLIEVEWHRPDGAVYSVDIEVEAYDRTGLLHDISAILSAEKVNITAAHTGNATDVSDRLIHAKMILTIEVKDAAQLSAVLAKIEQLQNVLKTRRKEVDSR